MGKPEDIPQDVWDAATKHCMAAIGDGQPYGPLVVARAILAAKAEERADIAETAEEFGMAAGEPALVTFADILRTNGDA